MQQVWKSFVNNGAWRLLRTRDLGLLWLGELISQIGDSLNRVALLWLVYEMSGSALKMSLVGILQTLPPLLLSPLLGVYLDRLRKKPTMLIVNALHGLLVASLPLLYGFKLLNLELLYVLVLVISVVATMFGPALLTSIPLIVRNSELVAANALIQSTAFLGVLIGPVVAGLGVSWFGIANLLYIDAASFLVAMLCTAFVRIPEDKPERLPLRPYEIMGDLREGLVYLFREQVGLLFFTLVAGFQNIGASAFVFILPAFVEEEFARGVAWLGVFWSALGAGMLLGSVSIALIGPSQGRRMVRLAQLALALGGVAVGALAFIRLPLAAAALMVVVGWGAAAFNPVVIALIQKGTPENLQARVLSAFNTTTMAAAMGGMAGFGWVADHVGRDASMVGIGGVLLATALSLAVVARLRPARRVLKLATSDRYPQP
ncbi:MFS transporter [Candidatus Methylocalor cossyra]|uniref:Permease, MFS family n=1 Tax=Candidatus Methylocalor cossyra TaxID=3108543 RepID=A0ABM9NM25_9GAMM